MVMAEKNYVVALKYILPMNKKEYIIELTMAYYHKNRLAQLALI